MPVAFVLAFDKAGRIIAARIAIMAITTSSSMSVNAPDGQRWIGEFCVRTELSLFIPVDDDTLREKFGLMKADCPFLSHLSMVLFLFGISRNNDW